MSFIGNEGIEPIIQLDSVGIGLQLDTDGNAINLEDLDLDTSEYLVVGEKTYFPEEDNQSNTKWSLLVNNNGVAVNTSRNSANQYLNSNTSLFVDKNIYCTGVVKARGLELNNITLEDPLTSSLIREFIINANELSANQPFQAGESTSYYDVYNHNYNINNVFTPNFVTLGGHVDTYKNTHPLNIVSTANNKFNSMHIAIRNDTNNEEKEPTKFSIGIIGGSNISPAIISTTRGTPLEFHISKSSSDIDKLYGYGSNAIPIYTNNNQYPALAIDENNNVGIGINRTSTRDFTRTTLKKGVINFENVINEEVKLEVNGLSCFKEILMLDYETLGYKSLDDIYVRSSGISVINTTQISEGNFLGNSYNFSNIGVNDLLTTNKLQVNTDVNVDNRIQTESLIVNNVANFTGVVHFDNDVNFTNSESININKLKVANDIYIGNRKIIPIDIDDPTTGEYIIGDDGSNWLFMYYPKNIATLDANSNVSYPNKLALGLTDTGGFDGVLNIIKDDDTTSNTFDITLKNTVQSNEYYANIGRLSRLNNIDNSLILNTNKVTGKRNNIYFYPETNMSELTNNNNSPNIKNVPPTMSINNKRVGINKYTPKVGYELDVEGNVAARDYYLNDGNEMHRTSSFIYQSKNFFNIYDSQTDKFCINYNNLTSHASSMKGLNVKRGINTDYYYQNDKIIETLQIANDTDGFYTNKKISIGWKGEDVSVPLQIRNLTTEDYNYSVIRIYRGVRGGGSKNNADYSGIDICEYDRNLGGDRNNERWFIYKNHTFNDVDSRNVQRIGPLQIGYIDKDTKPKTYGMSFYYNSTNSNYHIDVNKNKVSYEDNDSAMSIYGDLEVHGNINIIDKYGSNYNFRLSEFDKLTHLTQYIKTDVTTSTQNPGLHYDPGLPSLNNDIRYTGLNILYTPNKSVIIDSLEKIAIPLIVKQDNSNFPVTKFITYADNTSNCSSSLELAIYNSNLKYVDDDEDKVSNIKNIIKFNLSCDDDSNTNFDMSFFHDNLYKKFYNFKNNIDESGNILSSSTHIGIGDSIDDNSNVTFHIDDNNKYGIQVTNSSYAPAINLLYTGNTCNIYHTLSGPSFDNNYKFSIGVDITNKNNFNEPSNVFIIDAIDGNNIRKGARFGFNEENLEESFVIKTDYDTSAMAITSRYTSNFVFGDVDISHENLTFNTSSNWNNDENEYIVTYNYYVNNLPDIDNNSNSISDANKSDPNFILKSSVILEKNINYKTFHSNLVIEYNVSNLNVDFNNNETRTIIENFDSTTTNCELTFNNDLLTCNIFLNPVLSFEKNTIKADDLTSNIENINIIFSCNLNLKDNIASNYNFTYNYTNVILLPENLNISYNTDYEFNSEFIDGTSNMMYINNKITTDITPFYSEEPHSCNINTEIYIKQLDDNGIYSNIFLKTTTSNIVRINSNFNDITGNFFVERDNTIIYKTSNILPESFKNLSNLDNRLEYSCNIIFEDGSSNLYITSSNSVVNNNINNISRDMIYIKTTDSCNLIEDNFEIYGNNFTNKIYFEEYFNRLSDTQNDDYTIQIKNYNYNSFKPHITLLNEVDGSDKITGHEIYSYDGILEIKYSDNGKNNWVPLKIDADGNTFIKGGLEMEGDIKFDGKIYDANGNDLIDILNKDYYKEYQVNSSNIHFNSYGSNGVEIHAYSSSSYDDFKFFNVQDISNDGISRNDVMVLHKRLNEVPQYKIDLYGDIDTSNGILRVEGRDIISDTCNYILDSSNVLSNKISNLETDFISEEAYSSNRFIVNHIYDHDLHVNGDLVINSNLIVLGDTTTLHTDVYATEQLDIVNNGTDVAFKVKQIANYDIVNILNDKDEVFTILHNGNVGINIDNPNVSLEINRTDSIKIPVGTSGQRPTNGFSGDLSSHKGYIRYNTDLDRFEGFGTGNTWGALGGIKDVDGDTYISSENSSGDDNDELKFITSNFERMVITSNGLVGIGTTAPDKNLTIYSENSSLSIQDPRNNIDAVSSIELINGSNNDFDKNEDTYGWKISNSNELFSIASGSNNIINDRFIVDGKSGNIGIGIKPHKYEPQNDDDEFKVNINGSLNIINGDIYKDGKIFSGGGGGGSMGIISQNMNVQTLTENYTNTRFMSQNNAQNNVPDNGWRFIDNNLDTGFIIKIKPTHRKSKILLNLTCHIGFDSTSDSRWWGLKLYRKIGTGDWTEVKTANGNYNSMLGDNGDTLDVGGSTACWLSHNLGTSLSSYENFVANISGNFCDSPDTRNDVYYTVKWKSRLGDDNNNLTGDGELYLNRPAKYNGANTPVLSSSWVAQEIWQLGTPYIPSSDSNIITLYDQDYVGIGNTEPEYKLDLFGNFRSDGNIFVDGKIGINTYSPEFTIHINTEDGILIPAGGTSKRPDQTILKKGVIRYNTDNDVFEGYGPGDSWGSLGGVKDVNGDTYISAENNPGDNNDELKFFTSNLERMVLTSNGNLGIGNTKPNYTIDVNGEVNASAFNINGVPFRQEFPQGMMLQTKHITYTNTCTKSDIQTDWVPVDNNITTGFVIRVKPSHATSKILLNLICHIGMDYLQNSKWWGLKLYRKIGIGNWTEVSGANGTGDNDGSACWISHNLGAESSIYSHSITNVTGSYEDEPSTTDDVYYTIYWKSRLDGTGANLYLNKSAESYNDNYPKPSSSWSASEIWNDGVPYIPPISSSVISLSGENVGIGVVPTSDSQYKLNVYGDIKCHNLFQTSDKRYKNNIEQLDSILHLINDIVPVSYNTENDSKTKYGFIAQDLEDIIPDIVNIPRDRKDLYSIDYISMIPLLTKSIQELSNIINNQQNEINKLKSKL